MLSREAAIAPKDIFIALADALPRNAERREEIIAVGMLATALISDTDKDGRAELVETFCGIVRKTIAAELN